MGTRRARKWSQLGFVVLLAGTLLAASVAAGSGSAARGPGSHDNGAQPGNRDARPGKKDPTGKQLGLVKQGAIARWNRFGTPHVLVDDGDYLATGLPGDDVAAARAYLRANQELFGLSGDAVADLELLVAAPLGAGSAVVLRQAFDGLAAGHDGLVSIAVVDGRVTHVSSSLTKDHGLTGSAALSAAEAVRRAAADIGRTVDARVAGTEAGWTLVDVSGFTEQARARLVAVPTPVGGVVPAYETVLLDNATDVVGVTSWIDARSGALLVREDIVDQAASNPAWQVFPASPPFDYSSTDTRQTWCWSAVAGCARGIADTASPLEWDRVGPAGLPTETTDGNNARATENWDGGDPGTTFATPSATRDYAYAWTNAWHDQGCDPDLLGPAGSNDIDAAAANLFAMHNRMHDWSYHLGFTEATWNLQQHDYVAGGTAGDPEHGNVQAAAIPGARNNANQASPPDGVVPVTNMYLWQPQAAIYYAPCADGDFDMSVIGHEYGHAISNRMVAGPDQRLSSFQGNAMGEAWSDLAAMEYLNSNGFVPLGSENPFAIAAYVTGDPNAGIRNYGMNDSPLNYSNIGYDVVGSQVHADGEIWSAVNFDIREALIAKYGAGTAGLQSSCNAGLTPVMSCPGNRRWIQLVFDAWLLMATGEVSMLDARDAMLAADMTRFAGANQEELWNAFARRGLGQGASSVDGDDEDPVPDFTSPHASEATVTLVPGADAIDAAIELYVGDYEARSVPIADTDPATALDATFQLVPGTYRFVARGDGFGARRFTFSLNAGQVRSLPVSMYRNLASKTNGATASGDGFPPSSLFDDTELTSWGSSSGVAGKQVTVRLDPSKASHQIRRIQVSALRFVGAVHEQRFTTLRQFELWTCEAKRAVDCSFDSQFTKIFTSPADSFPAVAPLPRAPQMTLREFLVPQTKATHVRLVVVHSQCTGAPAYQGEQDQDPTAVTDCDNGDPGIGSIVTAAELQVFDKP